ILLHRVSEPGLFADELGSLASRRGIELVVLAGARRTRFSWLPSGIEGDDDEVLRRLVPDLADRDVWVCGPDGWADSVVRAARSSGVRKRDVWRERFGW
ncbi:MAG: oxidoreductase, partial [Nocardioidaceae bacterium]|nr:oxidoreductase [Nocardioidaceae bacterium]